jgi:hypothetical protein
MKPLICALAIAITVAACASSTPPPKPQAAPPSAALATLPTSSDPPAVLVTSAPDVASFRLVFERALGRAGFRVLHAGDASNGALAVALIGDGSGTSGILSGLSYVKQLNKLDATVSRDGRLLHELHATVSYTVVEQEKEEFEAFNLRVASEATQANDHMAVDLSNQLVAVVNH